MKTRKISSELAKEGGNWLLIGDSNINLFFDLVYRNIRDLGHPGTIDGKRDILRFFYFW